MSNPFIETSTKAIAVAVDEGSKEYDEIVKQFEARIGKITNGSAAKLFVLSTVLNDMPRLKVKEGIKFDLGTKKRFELKRLK